MRTLLCLAIAAIGVAGAADAAERRGRAERSAALRWEEVATAPDRKRIRTWRDSWTTALAKASRAGHGEAVAAEGALLRPDVALDDPAPPVGDYRCRMIKLGAQQPGGLEFMRYPPFRCRIAREAGGLTFAKLSGSQRPIGRLFAAGTARLVFLGTMVLGDERRALDYGSDRDRDMAGVIERIAPGRWRLALPWPQWESTLDVIELVPEK